MPKPAKANTKSQTKSTKPKTATAKAAKVKSVPAKAETIVSARRPKASIKAEPTAIVASSASANLRRSWSNLRHALPWGMIALVSVIGLAWQMVLIKPPASAYSGPTTTPRAAVTLRRQFQTLSMESQSLSRQESAKDLKVVEQATIQGELSVITTDLNARQWGQAKTDLAKLSIDLSHWQAKLRQSLAAGSVSASLAITRPPDGVFIPILLYHQTPTDFAQQLGYLRDHKYTTITMDQVAAALTHGAKLPPKPVVITFDDGYSSQWSAFQLLQQFQMKAVYYIITVRADSGCDAVNTNCNPDYLSWDQVKQLDASGLVTIGDHTVDHPDLTTLDKEHQQAEIISARQILQTQLGHPVVDFAYPYGSYDAVTLNLMRQDGFRTAVTTVPGQYQLPGDIYGLRRIRQAYLLP